jgi:hypothetical protein
MDVSRASTELAEGLRLLAAPLAEGSAARDTPKRRRGERDSIAAEAPLPRLVLLSGQELYTFIRRQRDPKLLRDAHRFECETLRRSSVAGWIEAQLRELGSPLGGPKRPPLARYETSDEQELVDTVQALTPGKAAEIYAWEHYHGRRRRVLAAAKLRCGHAGEDLVTRTAPTRWQQVSEPFPGFAALRTQPSARPALRAALGARSRAELEAAVEAEQQGRRRGEMLEAIYSELRLRRPRSRRRARAAR